MSTKAELEEETRDLRAQLLRARAELAKLGRPAGPRKLGPSFTRGEPTRNFPFKRPKSEDTLWRGQAAADGYKSLAKWIRRVLDEAADVEPKATTDAPALPVAYGSTDYTLRLTDAERAKYEGAVERGRFSSLSHWIRTRLNARCR